MMSRIHQANYFKCYNAPWTLRKIFGRYIYIMVSFGVISQYQSSESYKSYWIEWVQMCRTESWWVVWLIRVVLSSLVSMLLYCMINGLLYIQKKKKCIYRPVCCNTDKIITLYNVQKKAIICKLVTWLSGSWELISEMTTFGLL